MLEHRACGVQVCGELQLWVYRDGELVEHWRDRNLVVTGGKSELARLLAGDGAADAVTKIGVGEGTAPPAAGDTTLTSAFSKALDSYSYPAAGQVQFAFTVGTGDANGLTIAEWGLLCADDTLFARRTRAAIEQDAAMTITGTWTIAFAA